MFVGTNRLVLSPATVMQAVENEFNRAVFNSGEIRVTTLVQKTDGSFEFTIHPKGKKGAGNLAGGT